MTQPKMTTKTTWGTLKRGDIIYIRTSRTPEVWEGPFIVKEPDSQIVYRVNSDNIGFTAPDGDPAVYLKDPTKTESNPELGELEPVPPWILGQEHDSNPPVLRSFTIASYQTAIEALKIGVFTHDVERQAHAAMKKMWEDATNYLETQGETLDHINFYSGGMIRCFGRKDEALRESVSS